MKSANATIRLPDGQRILCYPGDLVGRMESCRVRLEDPRISEAHGMFSLRRDRLYLLFLRRPGRVRDGRAWNVEIHGGDRLELAEGVEIEILDLQLPTEQLALALDGGQPEPLGDLKYAIRPERTPFLVPDESPVVWRAGDRHYLRSDRGVCEIEPGETYVVGGVSVSASVIEGGTPWTQTGGQPIGTSLTLNRTDALRAQISDETGRTAELTHQPALVVWAIANAGGAATWVDVCNALWGSRKGPDMRNNLRNNVLFRMDAALRKLGFRDDLVVRSEGTLRFAEGVEWIWT